MLVFDTRAAAVAATIPSGTNAILTGGYATAGDGGNALYNRTTGSTPGGFQSADGAWWQLVVTGGATNVRQWGAVGNGVANDTAAFQNAVNATINGSRGIGTVYVPPGYYYVSGLNIASKTVRLVGSAVGPSVLAAVGSDDTTVVTVSATLSTLENLYILGKGSDSTTTFGAAQPAVVFNSVDGKVEHCLITGGSFALKITAADVRVTDTFAASTMSTACCLVIGTGCAGVRISGCKFDQAFPVSAPTNLSGKTSVPAWAQSAAFAKGDIATSQGFILQCSVAGTTSASGTGPTLLNYGQNIADGTVTWLLAAPVGLRALAIDTGAQEVLVDQTDMSGGVFDACMEMANNLAGTAPLLIHVTDSVFGGSLNASFRGSAGNNLTITGCEVTNSLLQSSIGIMLDVGWSGKARIVDNWITGSIARGTFGVVVNAGTRNVVALNEIESNLDGVLVAAGVTDFVISENSIGTSNTNPIVVAAGGSDYYNIVNNLLHGGAVSDGGTGAHKTKIGNN
jgi:hypothetical protein